MVFFQESSMSIDINGKKVEYWSGKSIISYIIPSHINLSMTNDSYDNLKENDEIKDMMNKVIIENGSLISYGMDKAMFTKTSKGLIHTIYNDLGPEDVKILLMIYKKLYLISFLLKVSVLE